MSRTALASVWPPNHLVASRAGHKAISPVEAIRRKCLDCAGQQSAEVKLCEAVSCPLWPFRSGRHPYTRKNLQEADSEHCASGGSLMPLACPSSETVSRRPISRKVGTSSPMRVLWRLRPRQRDMARPSRHRSQDAAQALPAGTRPPPHQGQCQGGREPVQEGHRRRS
jgi:hypothetical protein